MSKKIFVFIPLSFFSLLFCFILCSTQTFITPVKAVQSGAKRGVPDTSNGIHVWNDQLLPRTMTEEQIRFAATHYDGSMKMVRSGADKFRAYNPNFLILHYRLGQALGYRVATGDCNPNGDYIQIIEGNEWKQEWPGDSVVQPEWFFQYAGLSRVFWCDWGSYLMDTDNAGWRNYWLGEVTRQMAANDNDGVFADSLSVPTHLGPYSFRPNFPPYDPTFEDAYSLKIQRWLTYAKQQFGDRYLLIPNAGSWITTRDKTDYSAADGVMIERFAMKRGGAFHEVADWKVQLNRALGLIRQDKVLIANNDLGDPADLQTRLFLLSNYLLIKAKHTFINIELGINPEWFPEYELPIGSPTDAVQSSVDGWLDASTGLYRRAYSNGMVVVNPTNETRTLNLGGTYYLVQPSGGGDVPASGIPTGTINYQQVSAITLAPHTGAVLLRSTSSSTVTSVNAASYASGDLASEAIATAFGSNLATTTLPALSTPLPTNIGGTSVSVRDSSGVARYAPLFYVSPTQVNYQIPEGTAAGTATVTITNGNGAAITGTAQISQVAPGLFSASASGKGIAAAYLVRVKTNGTQSNELVVQYSASQQSFVPVPVNLGSQGEQVYLILFGTGLRRNSSTNAVRANIGGLDLPVSFAGAQSQFVGLDQVNVLLPRELAGRGNVNVSLIVDGKSTNAVTINIQ